MVLSALFVNIMKIRSLHQHQKVDKIVDVVYRMKVDQNYINPPPHNIFVPTFRLWVAQW